MTLYHWFIFLGSCSLVLTLLALSAWWADRDPDYDSDLIVDPDYDRETKAFQRIEIGPAKWL